MQNRTVRLSKPIYELLPYVYIVSGLLAVAGSYFLASGIWAEIVLVLGLLCVVGGAVIVLRRRDARARRTEYTGGSLDERKLN
jgi:hypothetical protein